MADGIQITQGSGTGIATDEGSVTGRHMQIVKLARSADGAESLIDADADGLKVNLAKSIDVRVEPKPAVVFPVSDNGGALSVDDGAQSLTVDAPASAPVAVRISDGVQFLAGLPVSDGGGTLSVDDGGGTISVDDGGGSLTIDGAITAAQGTPAAVSGAWPVKLTDGASLVGISDVGGNKALRVDVIQSVSAGTQTDKSGFTEGSARIGVIAGVHNETLGADPAEDQAAAVRITPKRGLHANLRTEAGAELATDAAPLVTRSAQPARVTKQSALTAEQTGAALWTPAAGKRFYLTKLILIVSAGGAGELTVFDSSDSAANRVVKGAMANNAQLVLDFDVRPFIASAADNVLRYTSGVGLAGEITLHGYEV